MLFTDFNLKIMFGLAAGAATVAIGYLLYQNHKADVEKRKKRKELVPILLAQTKFKGDEKDPSYRKRLQKVLMRTDSETLQYLCDHDIDVYLDRKLAEEEYGFWEREPDMIYDPNTRTVHLWDNGTEGGFFTKTANDHSPQILAEFVSYHKKYDNKIEEPQVGYHTHEFNIVTKTMDTKYSFKNFSDMFESSKHPTLLQNNHPNNSANKIIVRYK